VHFSGLSLAEDDILSVSDPGGSRLWTYTGRGPRHTGNLWAFAVEGDTAIVRLSAGREPGHGYRIDAVAQGTVPLDAALEAVTCDTSGLEDIACEISASEPLVGSTQRAVARLLFVRGNEVGLCTGWLVRGAYDSTLLTANHCIDSQHQVDSLEAQFNFQYTKCGGAILAPQASYAGGELIAADKAVWGRANSSRTGLDYSLITLLGGPEASWGELIPSARLLDVGDPIWIVQHPQGLPKQIGYFEDGTHTVQCQLRGVDQTYPWSAPGTQAVYLCPTMPGSSGSPVIDAQNGHALAIMQYAVLAEGCQFGGTEMSAVCADAGPLLDCAAD
jgi:hypothetical protein